MRKYCDSMIFNQQALTRKTNRISIFSIQCRDLSVNAVRNQQIVGSNPTGGSRQSSKYKVFRVHFGGRPVDLPPGCPRNVRVCQGGRHHRLDFLSGAAIHECAAVVEGAWAEEFE
jgi:hypothetical protein